MNVHNGNIQMRRKDIDDLKNKNGLKLKIQVSNLYAKISNIKEKIRQWNKI